VLAAAAVTAGGVALLARPAPEEQVRGVDGPFTVLDPSGRAITTAEVRGVGVVAPIVDERGRFATEGPSTVTVSAPGYLRRAIRVSPDAPRTVTLTPARDSVSLRFGGDTMMGRRFFHPVAWIHRGRALLPDPPTADLQAALLEPIRPFLDDTDLTILNLESTLITKPAYDLDGPRPRELQQEKELVIASHTTLPQALATSGVEIVDLANNHVNDANRPGLVRVRRYLREAGVRYFGAGDTIEEAWRPLRVEVRGQRLSFLGCTTVAGRRPDRLYVATSDHGGAAYCTSRRMEETVRREREAGRSVIVMIHGGTEYRRTQTRRIREMTSVARAAGAVAVVNGHPHVFGGVHATSSGVVVDTLGNFAFDQPRWPTLVSATVRIDLTDGRPARVDVDPFIVSDFMPHPATGAPADALARIAAGGGTGLRLVAGGAEWAAAGPVAGRAERRKVVDVERVPAGTWVADAGGARVGEDLLFGTGSFETADISSNRAGAGLWRWGKFAQPTAGAACAGTRGAVLERSPLSEEDVFISTRHRQEVDPGENLSLLADVRDATGGTIELRWYGGLRGRSIGVTSIPIEERAGDCRRYRIDTRVPRNASGVQAFVRLPPPGGSTFVGRLEVDELRLVRWAPPGSRGRRYDIIDGGTGTDVALRRDDAAAVRDGTGSPPAG